jgi:hypothetical protein
MKFKAALKYQLSGMKKPLIVYYLIIYCLCILMFVQHAVMRNAGGDFSSSGMEMASLIFLFVCGLNSFKSTFYMFLANGVSRRTMFKSFVSMIAPVAAGMAVIDSLNGLLLSSFGNYESLFHSMYALRYQAGTTPAEFMEGMLWMFAFYMFITMAGFLITTLYYRMNKAVKLLVSIGVPVFFFMVLPYIDMTLFTGQIYSTIWYIFKLAGGFLHGDNPYIAVLSCIISFAVFGGLSYLAMRKATVKK